MYKGISVEKKKKNKENFNMTTFNYKEIGSKEMYDTLYESVLKTRGLHGQGVVENLLHTPRTFLEDWRLLNNINEGVELLTNALKNKEVIGLIVDCDNDGIASASEFYRYVKRLCPHADIRILLHKGKQHGISEDIEVPSDVQLLVLPDAGTNDIDKQKELVAKGVKILNIDHHQLSDDWEEVEGVITINPQNSPNYKNKSISGSGVVYKFLQAMDNALSVDMAEDYRDLAGMGCLADLMDSTELDTRYLMNCAVDMDIIKNPFLKKLIQEKILKFDKLNLTSLAWQVVPSINSVTRLGKMEEKEAVFKAFLSDDEEVLTEGLKKATSCKSRQDRLKKKALEECKKYILEQGLTEYPVIVVDVTNLFEDNGLNGVIANGLSSEFNRPILIVGQKEEGEKAIRGSARNSNEAMCSDFRSWCKETGLFELAEGHSSSFGVEIKRNVIQEIMNKAKEDFGEVEKEKTHMVERVINFSDLNKKDVIAIGNLQDLWATNVKEPIFLVKNVRISSNKVERLGSRKNVLRFTVDGITFIKMFLSEDFYNRITLKDKVHFGSVNLQMDILCKFKKNEWEDKVYPQLEVIDIISKQVETAFEDIF